MAPFLPGLPPAPSPGKRFVSAAIPRWLPKQLAALVLSASVFSFVFSKGERHALRRRKPIPVSEWAGRHRHVRMSSIPGRWHNVFTPYLVGVMDAAGFPGVEVVILCKAPQTGGSEAGHNIIGYAVDRAPGPAMYVFPDENTARENAKDRIIPMIEDSPRLREYLTGYGDDMSSLRINMTNMVIYLGWSGSVSRLGNKPIRYLILDELDKYKNPKNEATSEALAEKRTTTWGRRKTIFKLSTPTIKTGPIWKALTEEASCLFDFWVRCPKCGHMQKMSFDRIVWSDPYRRKLMAQITGEVLEEGENSPQEELPDPETILENRSAQYICENLGCPWDDHDRDHAVRDGAWRDRISGLELSVYLKTRQPKKVGFHLPAWLSYFVSLSEVAHAFLKWKRSGHIDDLKNFVTQYKAEPWEEQFKQREETGILELCDTRPRGVVPVPEESGRPPVAALLAAVDTQDRYFRYEIRAFPYGEIEESWLVQAGTAIDFAALDQLFWQSEYRDGYGKIYRVTSAIIDAMGTRTSQVYRYCIGNRGRAFPYQGVQRLAIPLDYTNLEYLHDEKGNKVKIPGGLILLRGNATFFKSDLAARLTIAKTDPGAYHLHSNENGELNQYAREMCAEIYSTEKGGWINPHERPNHFWDCAYMNLVHAYHLGIRNWKMPDEAPRTGRAQQPRKSRPKSAADRLGNLRR